MAGLPIFDNEIKVNTGLGIFDPLIFDVDPRGLQASSEFTTGTTLLRRRTGVFNKQDINTSRSPSHPK